MGSLGGQEHIDSGSHEGTKEAREGLQINLESHRDDVVERAVEITLCAQGNDVDTVS